MRYSVFLPLLLAACGTFGIGEKSAPSSATKNKYSYCDIPNRLTVFRTSSEICRVLGGTRVDDDKAVELESYYQELNAN